MKILSVSIAGFGALSRRILRFEDGKACLLVADKDAGRRDWIRCLAALLYDFQKDGGGFDGAGHVECNPVEGNSYAGEIEFSVRDVRYRLKRDFRARTVELVDVRTGTDCTAEFLTSVQGASATFDIGTRLLGVSRLDFLRMSGTAADGSDLRSLRLDLEQAGVSDAREVTAEAALATLADARNHYRDRAGLAADLPETLEEMLGAFDRRVAELKAELERLPALRAKADEAAAKLVSLCSARDALAADLAAAGGDAAFRELAELDASILADHESREQLKKLIPERDRLNHRANFPASREAEVVKLADGVLGAAGRGRELEAESAALDATLRDLSAKLGSDLDEDGLRGLGELADKLAADATASVASSARADAAADELEKSGSARRGVLDGLRKLSADDLSQCRGAAAHLRDTDRRIETARQRIAAARKTCDEIEGLRRNWEIPAWLAAAVAVALLIAGLAGHPSGWGALAAAPIALGLLLTARRIRSSRGEPADRELAGAESELADAERERARLSQRLQPPAAALGLAGEVELAAELQRLADAPRGAEFLDAASQASAADADAGRLKRRAQTLLASLGVASREPPDADAVRAALPQAAQRLAEMDRLHEARRRRDKIAAELPALWAQRDAAGEGLRKVAAAAGLDPKLEADALVAAFRTAVREYERRRELVEVKIPEWEARRLEPAQLEQRSKARAELRARIAGSGRFQLVADSSILVCLSAGRSTRARLEQLDKDIAAARAELSQVWSQPAAREAALSRELALLKLEQDRAKRFEQASKLAREALDSARNSVRIEWIRRLEKASLRIVPGVLPGFTGLLFSQDFHLTLRQTDGKLVKPDELERRSGAAVKERLCLAGRLTLAEALCPMDAGETESAVPLMLTEPSVDEAKRTGAVKTLIGTLGGRRQLCILSTSRRKHEDWLRSEPSYRDRLQLLRI